MLNNIEILPHRYRRIVNFKLSFDLKNIRKNLQISAKLAIRSVRISNKLQRIIYKKQTTLRILQTASYENRIYFVFSKMAKNKKAVEN